MNDVKVHVMEDAHGRKFNVVSVADHESALLSAQARIEDLLDKEHRAADVFCEMKARLADAERVIEFYADDGNWDCDRKAYHDHIIEEDDMEVNPDGIGKVGGKLAREYLSKHRVQKPEVG